ncbi:MAG: 50S ribosomal protein L3 [Chloroflexi bacterium RBG_16_57_9]|nr:MAG: 50S ribosomal protein L3 [Chloroflexi bacterium RBG_16_57_9]
MKAILGKKVGMTQVFNEKGEVVPVTVIEAGPCFVTQIRTPEQDGYSAIQIGYNEVKPKRMSKAERGHLKNLPPLKHLREIRTREIQDVQLGQKFDSGIFKTGERVDVVGVSKGRGFQGGVKRHHFKGGPKTHGQSDRLRAPGSIGSGTTPGRVLKGTRMAGHMGSKQVTVLNLEVVQVDPERNLLLVRGAVPGANNGLLFIRKARKG